MTAFKLLTALISLLSKITDWAHDRQLISATEARVIADMHAQTASRVTEALEARAALERALDADPGRVRDWDQDRRQD